MYVCTKHYLILTVVKFYMNICTYVRKPSRSQHFIKFCDHIASYLISVYVNVFVL